MNKLSGMIRFFISILAFAIVIFFTSTSFSQVHAQASEKFSESIIEGSLIGTNGHSISFSTVGLGYPNAPQYKVVDVGTKGKYHITTDKRGLLILDFSGLNHIPQKVAIFIDRPKHIELNIQLANPQLKNDLSTINLYNVADSNIRLVRREKLQRNLGGSYSLEFETNQKQVGYTIFNGTQTPYYVLSGTGEDSVKRSLPSLFPDGYHSVYYSVVSPVNGIAYISVDPTAYPKGNGAGYMQFAKKNKEDERFNHVYQEIIRRRNYKLALDLEEMEAVAKGELFIRKQTLPLPEEIEKLSMLIKSEKIERIRQILLLNFLDLTLEAGIEVPEKARQALEELGAESSLWSIKPGLLISAITAAKDEKDYSHYVVQVVESLPDKADESRILGDLIARAEKANQIKISDALLQKLKQNYPLSGQTKYILSVYRNDVIKAGKSIPFFKAHSLEDSTIIYTPETFKEKVYLIEFWATWCSPCLVQLPFVTKAYEKFHSHGFEVLSYTFDDSRDVVTRFRRTRFTMPWFQSIDPALKASKGEMAKLFGVFSLPRAMLVDKLGIIVAIDDELDGEKLERLLDNLLKQ